MIPNDPADLWLDERRDDLTLVVSDHSLDFTDENTIVQYSEGMISMMMNELQLSITYPHLHGWLPRYMTLLSLLCRNFICFMWR